MDRSNFIKSLVIGTAVIAAAPVTALTPRVRDLYLVFKTKEFDLGYQIGILATIYDSDENVVYRHAVSFPAPIDSDKIEWASHELKKMIPENLRKRVRANIYPAELIGLENAGIKLSGGGV